MAEKVRDQRVAGQGSGGPARAAPGTGGPRTPAQRAADHAAIEQLADRLVPALVARLASSGLGEIEIREGGVRLRVRRPAAGIGANAGRRSGDRAARSQPGHAGHGHPPGAVEGRRPARDTRPASIHSTNGATPPGGLAAAPDAAPEPVPRTEPHQSRSIATSPAVGVYQPRADARAGTRVRAGDRLGAVDMLGVLQEVVAPADGVVGVSLVEPGQAVEYGQELVVIELSASSTAEA
jgi:biotin carboxyl carrier protein